MSSEVPAAEKANPLGPPQALVGLSVALLVLGILVLTIKLIWTQFLGLTDNLRYLGAADSAQLFQLRLQPLQAVLRNQDWVLGHRLLRFRSQMPGGLAG